jgi:hypothetical protein
VLVTRTNPADAVNWLEIEYTERDNFYNVTMIPAFGRHEYRQPGSASTIAG